MGFGLPYFVAIKAASACIHDNLLETSSGGPSITHFCQQCRPDVSSWIRETCEGTTESLDR